MNLEDYRTAIVSGSLALMLIAAGPTLGLVIQFPRGGERFSELWVLGLNHMAEDYPFNVRVNESYSVFVGVGNHMGVSSYYSVYVKFRNQTQPLPNAKTSEPSPLRLLYEFRAFVADGGAWEALLNFWILGVSHYEDSLLVSRISINDVVFSVDSSVRWNSEYKGFFFQLFFELWLYDLESQKFSFHNRFAGIWLNVTE